MELDGRDFNKDFKIMTCNRLFKHSSAFYDFMATIITHASFVYTQRACYYCDYILPKFLIPQFYTNTARKKWKKLLKQVY